MPITDDELLQTVHARGLETAWLFLIAGRVFVSRDAGDFQATSTYTPYEVHSPEESAALVSLLHRLAAPEYASVEELQDEIERMQEWEVLYGQLMEILQRHGVHDPFGDGDFHLVSDCYDAAQHMIQCSTAAAFTPAVVHDTQVALRRFSRRWEVVFALPPVGSREHAYSVYADTCVEHGQRGTSNGLGRLLDRWLADPKGVGAHPPADEGAVLDAFAQAGSHATADVVRLYGLIGGMDKPDHEDWRLWPLAEVVAENSEPTEHGVAFSDYLIGCWIYRLKLVTPDTSAVFVDFADGKAPILVASSLADFFDAYLADARQLLDPPAGGGPL
jgi:hypothetical protein